MNEKIFALSGKIQRYAWGGQRYIPQLLGHNASSQHPAAEYWLGAHPAAPSTLESGEALPDFLAKHRQQLHFLFKVLDVKDMLSIQVHPNRQQAIAGFAKENAANIALSAKNRNYKDQNHKPELMIALSEFWLMHGFADTPTIVHNLRAKPYFSPVLKHFEQYGLEKTFAWILDNQNSVIQKVQTQLKEEVLSGAEYQKHQTDFWVQRWFKTNPMIFNGILSVYFLNLVKLAQGEGIYQPNGLLHAYLEGQNIELMANSDNVLRAGLTPKHMDIAELLAVGEFESTEPNAYKIAEKPFAEGLKIYPTPFEEFELYRFTGNDKDSARWPVHAPQILMCIEGSLSVHLDALSYSLKQGQSLLLLPQASVEIQATCNHSDVFISSNR